MTKIGWISRHSPLQSQISSLKNIFGDDVQIFQDKETFKDASDIAKRIAHEGYDDIVVVAPMSVLDQLIRLGVHPLYAEMDQCLPEFAELSEAGRNYRFVKFKRIKKIQIIFEDVK